MPSWLTTVIESSSTRKKGQRLTLVSIETFQSIIESYSRNTNLRAIKSFIQTSNSDTQSHRNYCKEIIKTLWSLLDEPEDHEKIVQLLKKFDKLLPNIFSSVVTQELNPRDREVKIRAVKKFSIFWKLTTADYPEYKPFQPISERLRESRNDQ